MAKFSILIFIIILTLIIFIWKPSFAFYTDASSSQSNTFSAASVFPTPTSTPPTGPGDVVINEVFADGGADSEWIELFNPTGTTIILDGWKITDNSSTDIFQSGASIPANGFAIIVASGSSLVIPAGISKIETDTSLLGNGLSSTGDSLLLEKPDGTDVDTVSFGSVTTPFTLPQIPTGNSLARNPNGQDTNAAADWVIDSTPSIGVSN